MKKFLLAIPAVMLFAACHNYQADIDNLEEQKRELIASANYKDSTIAAFINEVNEIETNLAAIELSQDKVAMSAENGELKGNQIDRIKENITAINDLVKESKERVEALSKKFKASGVKVANLEKLVASLNNQISERDKQLAELNVKVSTLNTTVEELTTNVNTLTTENTDKGKVIEDQTSKLHTAYYATGSAKELLAKQVLVKEGGFLGLGKEKKLKNDLNGSALSQIDITKTLAIPINAKDAKIVTSHPTDSYTIEHAGKDKISALVINDPEKFWKSSKVLVVVTDK